jgi:transketolase C-terminal domain/subunit
MKPYIGLAHDGTRVVVNITAVFASSESEAYLCFAKLITASDINLADVKVVVWEAGTTNPVTFGHDHTENFEYWTTTTTL